MLCSFKAQSLVATNPQNSQVSVSRLNSLVLLSKAGQFPGMIRIPMVGWIKTYLTPFRKGVNIEKQKTALGEDSPVVPRL